VQPLNAIILVLLAGYLTTLTLVVLYDVFLQGEFE